MVRRAAKVDVNHAEIVHALREAGCFVQDLSAVGKGCPDLLVSRAGVWYLIEVKRPKARGQAAGTLTDDQIVWIDRACADVHVVKSIDDALRAVGLM